MLVLARGGDYAQALMRLPVQGTEELLGRCVGLEGLPLERRMSHGHEGMHLHHAPDVMTRRSTSPRRSLIPPSLVPPSLAVTTAPAFHHARGRQ